MDILGKPTKNTTKRKAKLGLHWLGPSMSSPSGFGKKISTLPGSIFLPKTLTVRPCRQWSSFLFFLFFSLWKCLLGGNEADFFLSNEIAVRTEKASVPCGAFSDEKKKISGVFIILVA
ncbi:hypothetical protein [Schleiferia thermophila]|nr:hypothetical protein [Schleiferia thermophila]